jgi:TM2 domain-containing membrane protein YozV
MHVFIILILELVSWGICYLLIGTIFLHFSYTFRIWYEVSGYVDVCMREKQFLEECKNTIFYKIEKIKAEHSGSCL